MHALLPTLLLALTGGADAGPRAPETAAPRLAWGDFDADGRDDLAVSLPDGALRLLRNAGDGRFEDATATAFATPPAQVRAATWRDLDGDGLPELLALGPRGASRLYRNAGAGALEDVSAAAGLGALDGCVAAEWLDYDGDGRDDLALALEAGGTLLLHGRRGPRFEPVELVPGAAADGRPAAVDAPAAVRAPRPAPAPPAPAAGGPASAPRGGAGAGGAAGGARSNAPAGGGAVRAPGRSLQAGERPCSSGLDDLAAPGACIPASSLPQLGALFPLSPELFVDATTGWVGLGSTNPAARLDVAGTARVSGFELPVAPANGYVLTSDAYGVGTWQPAGAHTLDEAYDSPSPGAGRAIDADSGPVRIDAGGNVGLEVNGTSLADAIEVTSSGTADGVEVTRGGAGSGFHALHSGPGDGLRVDHAGTGDGVYAEHDGAGDCFQATVTPIGTGRALLAQNLNVGNGSPVIRAIQDGPGRALDAQSPFGLNAVRALSGFAPTTAMPVAAGSGESEDDIGLAGVSDLSHGVYGATGATAGEHAGVVGLATAGTGSTHGVWGDTQSLNGNAAGVAGRASTGAAAGVHGYSISTQPDAAGVRAQGGGAGAGPNAAALELFDGAITVAGPARAADTIAVPPLYRDLLSCTLETIGKYEDVVIANPLIVDDSILLLTVEKDLSDGDPYAYFAQVLRTSAGAAVVRVATSGTWGDFLCPPLPSSRLNYLILNPLP